MTLESARSTEVKHPQLAPRGSLADLPARSVMNRLHEARFTGTLSFSKREKKKKLWFSRGEVFRVQSNLVPELIGRMMVDRHWLTEADLNTCLNLQRDLMSDAKSSKRLGELVQEIHSIDPDELKILLEQQAVGSLLQSLTWKSGDYELESLDLKADQIPIMGYQELSGSVDNLLSTSGAELGRLFEILETWALDSKPVELAKIPLWSILATCRRLGSNGIISVRRQNKLYELVLKYGVPLTLYEGTFGQPRQTIVVRQASDEHEEFFLEQIYRLLSFLTGTVYFRSLNSHAQDAPVAASYLQFREETGVTKSVSAEEVPFELREDFLKSQPQWSRWHYRLMRKLKDLRLQLLRYFQRKLRAHVEKNIKALQQQD